MPVTRAATYHGETRPSAPRGTRFQWTGEKRAPRAGEWYLSGAIVCAYQALADLSTSYHIARPVAPGV